MSGTESNAGRARARPLGQKEKLFVAAISRGESVTAAARAAGIRGRSTAYRWLERPDVAAALEQHRADRSDAVQAIRDLVRSPGIPPLVKLKAATQLAEMTGGSTKNGSGLTDRDAAIAGTILP